MLELDRWAGMHSELKHELWLEIYGDNRPKLGWGADPTPKQQNEPDSASAKAHDLYEYRWGFGYPAPSSSRHPRKLRLPQAEEDFSHLSDPAAHVYLYFSANGNWRVSETLATVKHLSPVREERTLREELVSDFNALEPAIGALGDVAAEATGMPELGSIAQTVSHLKLTSVPQTPSSQWFVRRVDWIESPDEGEQASDEGEQADRNQEDIKVFHGIEWELSLNLMEQLGRRVTGGLLVSFASVRPPSIPDDQPPGLKARAVLHYASAKNEPKDIWIPEHNFLELALIPQSP